MNLTEITAYLNKKPNATNEIAVMVDNMSDLELEDTIYYSLLAVFKRNVKIQPLMNMKMIIVSGVAQDILNILTNPAFSRFFVHTSFGKNEKYTTL